MFYTLGPEEVLETCAALAQPYLVGTGPHSTNNLSLGLAWRRMLIDRQSDENIEEPLIGWRWVSNSSEINYLDLMFDEDSRSCTRLDFSQPAASWTGTDDQRIINDGWGLLFSQEPELGAIASILITTIYSMTPPRYSGSGSLHARLGTVYINPTDSWRPIHIVECLVRELTRQMIWNDEARYGHYPKQVRSFASSQLIRSSVDREMLSLPQALAEVVVGAEQLCYREKFLSGGFPGMSDTELAEHSIVVSERIRDLENIENLTTNRFWKLLTTAEERLAVTTRQ
jgi:hypothetical protein